MWDMVKDAIGAETESIVRQRGETLRILKLVDGQANILPIDIRPVVLMWTPRIIEKRNTSGERWCGGSRTRRTLWGIRCWANYRRPMAHRWNTVPQKPSTRWPSLKLGGCRKTLSLVLADEINGGVVGSIDYEVSGKPDVEIGYCHGRIGAMARIAIRLKCPSG